MTHSIQPLGNRVLIRRMEPETVLKGGVIIPDSSKRKQERGVVIAMGDGQVKSIEGGVERIPIHDLHVGDTVLIGKYTGDEISLDNVDYVIVKADDIIAVLSIAE
jgi:chaperonin GroES